MLPYFVGLPFLFDSKSNIFFTSPSHLQSREIYLVENLSFSLVTHLIVSNYKRHFIEYFAYMEILTVYGLCRNNLVTVTLRIFRTLCLFYRVLLRRMTKKHYRSVIKLKGRLSTLKALELLGKEWSQEQKLYLNCIFLSRFYGAF